MGSPHKLGDMVAFKGKLDEGNEVVLYMWIVVSASDHASNGKNSLIRYRSKVRFSAVSDSKFYSFLLNVVDHGLC